MDAPCIAAWADLPVPFVTRVVARLRATKLWRDSTMCVMWPDAEDAHAASIMLILDAMNACGHVRRVDDDHFQVETDTEQIIARVSGWLTSRERRAYEQRTRRAGMAENPSTRLRRARVAAGKCRDCGASGQRGEVRCTPCKERRQKYYADWKRRKQVAATARTEAAAVDDRKAAP